MLQSTLTKKIRIAKVIRYDANDSKRFQNVNCGSYVATSRGMPSMPSQCIGKNVAVEADEEQPEVHLAERLVQQAPRHLREPVVHAGEDAHQASADEHVVEVPDDEVRPVHVEIERNRRPGRCR